jgi:hypothetical protein
MFYRLRPIDERLLFDRNENASFYRLGFSVAQTFQATSPSTVSHSTRSSEKPPSQKASPKELEPRPETGRLLCSLKEQLFTLSLI